MFSCGISTGYFKKVFRQNVVVNYLEFWFRIQEFSIPNFAPETDYSKVLFFYIPQNLQENSGIML